MILATILIMATLAYALVAGFLLALAIVVTPASAAMGVATSPAELASRLRGTPAGW